MDCVRSARLEEPFELSCVKLILQRVSFRDLDPESTLSPSFVIDADILVKWASQPTFVNRATPSSWCLRSEGSIMETGTVAGAAGRIPVLTEEAVLPFTKVTAKGL